MGLFDDPYVDPDERTGWSAATSTGVGLQAARETITLLKNENQLAPLDLAQLKTIASSDPTPSAALGGYSASLTQRHLLEHQAKVGDR